MRILTLLAMLVVPCVGTFGQWSDSFETYPVNSGVLGLGGWTGWDGVIDPAADAVVSDSIARTGAQSLEIIAPTGRLMQEFSAYTSGIWTLSGFLFVPSTSLVFTESWFFAYNTYNPSDPTLRNVSTQIKIDSLAGTITSIGGSFFFMPGTRPLAFDQWIQLEVVLDLDSNSQQVFYNQQLLASGPWQQGGLAELQAFAIDGNIGADFFWDDFSLCPNASVPCGTPPPLDEFQRGDCDNSGSVNLADVIYLLGHLFPFGSPNALDCLDACDADDSGVLNLPDAVVTLTALFAQPTVPLSAPYGACGPDPTGDVLTCHLFGACP